MKTSALQLYLVLIVLTNIVFVHITGAVGLQWFIPMYGLTLAAPILGPLQERAAYRIGWNVGVLTIFAILVADAMTSGIRYLLEDGLILAAFCQVHLLNVIRRQAGADLLFFNSFLIALVTSLFCQDLVFCAVFAIYAIILITALHLNAIGDTSVTEQRRVVLRQSLRHTVVALATTAAVFAFFPRDFERQGFLDEQLLNSVSSASTGFSDAVQLGQTSSVSVSRQVVMRVRVLEGEPLLMPELWRGATMSYYRKEGWHGMPVGQNETRYPTDADWSRTRLGRIWTRTATTEARIKLRVDCPAPGPERIFAPLSAQRIETRLFSDIEPLRDGTLRCAVAPVLGYEMTVGNDSIGLLDPPPKIDEYVQLDDDKIPQAVALRLLDAIEPLGSRPDPSAVADACRDYLSRTFSYLLPGERGAARNLTEFINGAGGGHCEYFATALALMLRLHEIPCRIATGYRVSEWNEESSEFIVRDSHAHAWVEVWDAQRGWYSVDATPAAEEAPPSESMWEAFRAAIEDGWAQLLQFDGDSRNRLMGWVASLPGRLVDSAKSHPLRTTGIASAIFLTILLLVRSRRRRPDRAKHAVAARYRRTLRRLGLEPDPCETPRELLARSEALGELEAERLERLRDATQAHERARYALSPR